ncbi:hypothetical protein ACOMHN_026996 [Nucella lapillus]
MALDASKGLSSASCRLRILQPVLRQCTLLPSSLSATFSDHTDHIQVTPRVSLFDQKVHVKVHDLPSKAKVTLHMTTEQEWRRKPAMFRSCGSFVTSDAGDLDLQRDGSLGGTYTGLDPMGLFWSLKPCPSGLQNIRLVVRNGDDPVLYTLSLYLGHWSLTDLVAKETTLTPLHSTMVTRLKKAADVRRIPVRDGGVRGMLFLPPGEGPHPGVIDMFGSAGGIMEIRASLLASHGFAVLALPFFKYDDLPNGFYDITFDYFEEAASWLSSHKEVSDGGIGVVAVSAGATIALMMAWKCPEVKAVVSINGPLFIYHKSMFRKDGTLLKKGIERNKHALQMTRHGMMVKTAFDFKTEDFLPVWESSARILLLMSGDDGQVDSHMADLCHSMYPRDKRHLMEVVHYPGAGHLLEPPYTPHCRSCISPFSGMDMLWGGNPEAHAPAQEDSWQRLQTFLRTHLP